VTYRKGTKSRLIGYILALKKGRYSSDVGGFEVLSCWVKALVIKLVDLVRKWMSAYRGTRPGPTRRPPRPVPCRRLCSQFRRRCHPSTRPNYPRHLRDKSQPPAHFRRSSCSYAIFHKEQAGQMSDILRCLHIVRQSLTSKLLYVTIKSKPSLSSHRRLMCASKAHINPQPTCDAVWKH